MSAIQNLALLGVLTIAAIPVHAHIYKTVDNNGVTVFTDKSEKVANDPNATRVEERQVPNHSAYRQLPHESRAELSEREHFIEVSPLEGKSSLEKDFDKRLEKKLAEKRKQQASIVDYQLKMVSPLPQSTYRRGVGNVNLSVAITPALQLGHTLTLSIDGEKVATGASGSYPTTQLIRGEHTASASVVDAEGRTLGTDSVSFYVHQTSKIIQDKRKAEEKRKKEAALPWWKRQIKKINPTR